MRRIMLIVAILALVLIVVAGTIVLDNVLTPIPNNQSVTAGG